MCFASISVGLSTMRALGIPSVYGEHARNCRGALEGLSAHLGTSRRTNWIMSWSPGHRLQRQWQPNQPLRTGSGGSIALTKALLVPSIGDIWPSIVGNSLIEVRRRVIILTKFP